MFNFGLSEFIFLAVLWPIFAWLAFAAYCAPIARSKKLLSAAWFLGGLLFGPVALIAVRGMAPKKTLPIEPKPTRLGPQ